MPPDHDADPVRRRAEATDLALGRRAAELAGQRRQLADRARRVPTEIARARLLAAAELTAGLRRLRDDARAHLERADLPDRRAYPELLATAVAELGRRYRCRGDELVSSAVGHTLAGLDLPAPAPPDPGGPPPSPPSPPPRSRRWPPEQGLIVLAGVSAGAGLARLAWVGGPLPVGLASALGVSAGWWMARARRAAAERARLAHWTGEVLADLRAGLDAQLAERVLDAERSALGGLERLTARLDRQVAAHQRCVHAVLARRREGR